MLKVFSESIASIGDSPYLLEQVTEDLVKTAEGRRRYFDFLSHYREIEPVYKLYGVNAPSGSQFDLKIISAHAKKLCLHIHPDKGSTEEYLTELFQMVWDAKIACEKTKTEFPAFASYSDNSHAIISLIKKNKWCQAKLLLARNSQVGNTVLDILFAAVCLRLGDFEAAIERIPPELTKIKITLEKCKEQFSTDFTATNVEERIYHLNLSIEMFQGLSEMYMSEKISGWPTPGYFDHVTPHRLFVLLKECFKSKNDPLMYERYLRDAIRHCPDGIQSDIFYFQKQQLINELNGYLEENYLLSDLLSISFIHDEMKRLAPLAYQKMLSAFQKTTLAEGHKQEIAILVDNLCSKGDPKYLDQLIYALETISAQSTFTSLVDFVSLLSPQIGQGIVNYVGHSVETKDMFNLWLPRLKGWAYYLRNDKERAAHYFSQGRDYMNLGCTLVEMGCFAEALVQWNNISEKTMQHVFLVMNFCDTLSLPESATYEREWLGPIDDHQLRVLSSFSLRATASPTF